MVLEDHNIRNREGEGEGAKMQQLCMFVCARGWGVGGVCGTDADL